MAVRKFSRHVATMRDAETVQFKPGDKVPAWLKPFPGEHVLEPLEDDSDESDAEAQDEGQDAAGDAGETPAGDAPDGDGGEDAPAADATPAVDFTKPAPRTRSTKK